MKIIQAPRNDDYRGDCFVSDKLLPLFIPCQYKPNHCDVIARHVRKLLGEVNVLVAEAISW